MLNITVNLIINMRYLFETFKVFISIVRFIKRLKKVSRIIFGLFFNKCASRRADCQLAKISPRAARKLTYLTVNS